MNVFLYGDEADKIVTLSRRVILDAGCSICPHLFGTDVAIAPLLRKKILSHDLASPLMGTLIFHPSLLPVHRGRDAIRWSFFNNESYSGATWFWADDGLDTGDICEQEVLLIMRGETPRQFYERAVIPSALRMLNFMLVDLLDGNVRRRPQVEENSTYDPPFQERSRRVSNIIQHGETK